MRSMLVLVFAFTLVSATPKSLGSQPPLGKQKTCPVTGSPVKENISLDFHGQRIYFCCPGCKTKFEDEPAKYLQAVYREVYPQRVQVVCPVMGGPADFKISTEYKGGRVYFCCADCIKDFNADPAKYEKKLRESFTEQVHDPVTGAMIDPQFSTDYKGKPVYFSSRESMRKFKSDPAKYVAGLLPEVGVLARGPKAGDDVVLCPECGDKPASEAIRREVKTATHNGKVYFICGTACAEAFKSNPAAFAGAVEKEMRSRKGKAADSAMQMSGEPTSDTPAESDTRGHSGHHEH